MAALPTTTPTTPLPSGASPSLAVRARDGGTAPLDMTAIRTALYELAPPALHADPALRTDAEAVLARLPSKLPTSGTVGAADIWSTLALTLLPHAGSHPVFGAAAAALQAASLRERAPQGMAAVVDLLQARVMADGSPAPLLLPAFAAAVRAAAPELDAALDFHRDALFRYNGLWTLENRHYLLAVRTEAGAAAPKHLAEAPQHMWMRVAAALAFDTTTGKLSVPAAVTTYRVLSQHVATFATPTLLAAGTVNPQMASCFLSSMRADSLPGIVEGKLVDDAYCSKGGGGLGGSLDLLRPSGAPIKRTNGGSNGLVPLAAVFDAVAAYVDQGGKRRGAFALYCSPWHADWPQLTTVRDKQLAAAGQGSAPGIFLGCWASDDWMTAAFSRAPWHTLRLPSPEAQAALVAAHGSEFTRLYRSAVAAGHVDAELNAGKMLDELCVRQLRTGGPYLLCSSAAAALYPLTATLGPPPCSNLCTEIIEYNDSRETAVCNLASISLRAVACRPAETDLPALSAALDAAVEEVETALYGRAATLADALSWLVQHLPAGAPEAIAVALTAAQKRAEEVPGSLCAQEVLELVERVLAAALSAAAPLIAAFEAAVDAAAAGERPLTVDEAAAFAPARDAVITAVATRGAGQAALQIGNAEETLNDPTVQSNVLSTEGVGTALRALRRAMATADDARVLSALEVPADAEAADAYVATYVAPHVNWQRLAATVRTLVAGLNAVVDNNAYPTPATHRSNLRHRPVGIGVQGWQEALTALRLPYGSWAAARLRGWLAEAMYYHAVAASCDAAAVTAAGGAGLALNAAFNVLAEADSRDSDGSDSLPTARVLATATLRPLLDWFMTGLAPRHIVAGAGDAVGGRQRSLEQLLLRRCGGKFDDEGEAGAGAGVDWARLAAGDDVATARVRAALHAATAGLHGASYDGSLAARNELVYALEWDAVRQQAAGRWGPLLEAAWEEWRAGVTQQSGVGTALAQITGLMRAVADVAEAGMLDGEAAGAAQTWLEEEVVRQPHAAGLVRFLSSLGAHPSCWVHTDISLHAPVRGDAPCTRGELQYERWAARITEVRQRAEAAGIPERLTRLHADVLPAALSGRWDWAALRQRLGRFGQRNVQLIAPMPTATTSLILNNSEGAEAAAGLVYRKLSSAGTSTIYCEGLQVRHPRLHASPLSPLPSLLSTSLPLYLSTSSRPLPRFSFHTPAPTHNPFTLNVPAGGCVGAGSGCGGAV